MKIQFATIEAMVSLLLALSFATFYAFQTNESVSSAYTVLTNLRSSTAIYDLSQQIDSNSALRSCILEEDYPCARTYLYQYAKVLGLKKVSLEVNGTIIGNLTGGSQFACFPISQNEINQTICVYAGD
ncbi:MAG: hypothetical protein KGH54_02130 [Candidatus Micrarchaeota archaeon]|nr:hypothetical protein [Candidatus Micrarchaeota archaeon]